MGAPVPSQQVQCPEGLCSVLSGLLCFINTAEGAEEHHLHPANSYPPVGLSWGL